MFRPIFLIVCLVGFICTDTATSVPPKDPIKEHAKARLEVARKGLAEAEKQIGDTMDYADIWVWSKRVLKAELAVSTNKNERIAALEAHLRRALKLEQFALREYKRGGFSHMSVLEAKYRRYDIELRLAEEKARPESPSR